MFEETGRPQIDGTRWEGQENVPDYVNGSRNYFSRPEVKDKIEILAECTLAWMRENKQSYSPTGDLIYEAWWPVPSVTDCKILKLAGEKLLADRAFEHGILHFLRGLEEEGVIGKLNKRIIGLVVTAMTPIVLNQLVIYRFHDRMPNGVSLRTLSALFGNGQNTKPAKIRDRLLGDLAGIGLFEARENEGWDISIGPVGELFFKLVYTPIMNEVSIEYKEPE